MPDWLPSLPVLLSAAVVVVDLGLRIAAIGIIPGNRKPSVGMAWLLMILFVPLLGLVAFAFFGRARLGERRHAKQALATERIRERTAGLAPWAEPSPELAPLRSATELNRNLGALPVQPGNTVELCPDYAGSIAAMTAAVRDAEHFVHVEFYITAWDEVTDPFFEALLDADRRGVRVRLLLDHLGSRGIPGYADLVKRLDASGLDWRPMLPVRPLRGEFRRPDLRNHRKILVVDGRVAFTGSLNLVEPGYNKPKNHERGPAVGGAHLPAGGAGGHRAQRALRHRLVRRDRRGARAARGRPRGARTRPGRRRRRDVPGGAQRARASRARTTCACSTR